MRIATALLIAVLGAAGCERGPTAASVAGTHAFSLLALGDSYTIGQSVPAADRWPVQLAALFRGRGVDVADPLIIAQTGWTTDELSAAISRVDPHGPFDFVALLIGVNDQFRGATVTDYRPRFTALLSDAITLAGGRPERVVVLSIPDWGVMPFAAGQDRGRIGQEIDRFNAVDRDECARHRVLFVDVTPTSREAATQPALRARDGLHPSGEQYRRWARLADAALRAAGQ